MLTHKIIKVKPHVHVIGSPIVRHFGARPKITTQKELDDYLEKAPVVGSMIKYRTPAPSAVLNEFMVNYVLEVQNDVAELQHDGCGDPRSHLIIQLGVLRAPGPHARWMDISDYVPLTHEDFDKVVNADVQNRIQEYLAQRG